MAKKVTMVTSNKGHSYYKVQSRHTGHRYKAIGVGKTRGIPCSGIPQNYMKIPRNSARMQNLRAAREVHLATETRDWNPLELTVGCDSNFPLDELHDRNQLELPVR